MIEMVPNYVYKPFIGGKLLREFEGIKTKEDNHFSERWICSTTISENNKGLSKTIDGNILKDITTDFPNILVKLIDSKTRLMIQVHPDKRKAQKYFDYPFGKTEAWYILNKRNDNAHIYLGFKKGITKQKWEDLFIRQDIEGMLNSLHKIPIEINDTFYVPAGVPHAMGEGVFFAEIQEPSDITLRTERISPANEVLSNYDLHHGTKFKILFECFNYCGLSFEETIKKYKIIRNQNFIINKKPFSIKELTLKKDEVAQIEEKSIGIALEGRNKGKDYYFNSSEIIKGPSKWLIFNEKITADN